MSREKLPSPEQLTELQNWIANIPFTRPIKGKWEREFADGVLCSQVVYYYFPRWIEKNTCIASSTSLTKRENWTVLNKKIFPKLKISLSKTTIEQLASARDAVIYKVLYQIMEKIKNAIMVMVRNKDCIKETIPVTVGSKFADSASSKDDSPNDEDDIESKEMLVEQLRCQAERLDMVLKLKKQMALDLQNQLLAMKRTHAMESLLSRNKNKNLY